MICGYSLENCVPCCTKCNLAKHSFSVEEWFKQSELLVKVLPNILRERFHKNVIEFSGLTYDDVVLIPQYSTVTSRKAPDVTTCIGNVSLNIPIVASPMNTITDVSMCKAMEDIGGIAVLHRYMSTEDQLKKGTYLLKQNYKPFMAVGVSPDEKKRIETLIHFGLNRISIDVANAYHLMVLELIKELKSKYNDGIEIMAGNVCTYEGTKALAEAGANSVRVGIGCGSLCKTRVVSGHGTPQLTALQECSRIKDHYPNLGIIADGGIKVSGDITKAIAIGADCVMLGSLLAGTDEAPGAIIEENGRKYKMYAGMASSYGRSLDGWFDDDDSNSLTEGESTRVLYKGTVKKVVDELVGGLKIGMSYCNGHNIKQLQQNAKFQRVTYAGFLEGTPHLLLNR
jgi:IMP dehydrogenase